MHTTPHHTTPHHTAPTTGRISSGRRRTAYFIDRTDSARADIIFCQKKSTRPTSPDSLTETGFRASGTILGPLFL